MASLLTIFVLNLGFTCAMCSAAPKCANTLVNEHRSLLLDVDDTTKKHANKCADRAPNVHCDSNRPEVFVLVWGLMSYMYNVYV